MVARGIRNNNPGNIRKSAGTHWRGQIDTAVDPDFCVFDTMDNGVRALAVLLINYRLIHKINTLRSIINRWAPAIENDTDAYVADVAKRMGIDQDALVNTTKIDLLTDLVIAICGHECGPDVALITRKQLAAGIHAALHDRGLT